MSEKAEFTAGRVLSRSFSIWLGNLVTFILMTAILYLPLIVYTTVLLNNPDATVEEYETYNWVTGIGSFILNLIIAGAVTYTVFQKLRGEKVGMAESITVGMRRLLPVLGTGLIAGVVIMLGTLALIIPGIIFACMLWVAVPVTVVERVGVFDALKRSAALSKDLKGVIFGILLLLGLIGFFVGLIMGTVIESATTYIWVSLAVDIALGALSAVVGAVGYHDLRVAKEGIGIEELVAVFA